MSRGKKLHIEQAWVNWINCLNGNDTNSIFRQISTMIWDTAIFRIIVESRQIQVEKNSHEPKINGSLHSFIDRNYFQTQATYIRRITDKTYGLTGERGVYSIYALLSDISAYRDELTRGTFFRLRNMSYDYEEVRENEREFIRKQPPRIGFFIPPEYDWESIVEVHEIFDRLGGSSLKHRSPTDKIDERFFTRLQERLSVCQTVTKYVDKFVAHLATPESRSIHSVNESEVTFKHLWEAQQVIFEVAEFLSVILFSEGHVALAIENPDFFQYWETPMFENVDMQRMMSAFDNYRKETEQWNVDGIENTWHWIES
jgi:hypothetical protein